ncbi:MAG: uroporphyrinogen-III C-methyltransferase [Candidatus Thiodiazotropha sp.]|nr:uroporphyrinogen-III C-methyltransferase [Candidatus Thiodiazotropha taylori]MBT3065081.1 uroporphyrinogen-III C-methyltransferase [Candidatus Thiodiazotropha sp. (ex Lucina pensylvanica)]MBV2096600.1 uroporphyrinogen-III C-methyltransferase [Candidatus Thiodiazotropha sp. (ex Codakia orbicularis)]PUB79277.1 MAG: uroporphyrinogen-III C-methyltransferase [gamma proteobacterium symbiont of Ctena orbiculata]PUB80662.1 MAG: uroporphyrinogen-III C-methyltransferase [gamma proteobacterium symbiont
MKTEGVVYLVGSGPGDPELLTVKALRLMQTADVVVYDRLVSPEIMAMIPPGVSRIAVGKSPGMHCVPQHEINALLTRLARKSRMIVRLKGGDPFVFGRGSEEALHLRRQGVRYEVVPGLTAASAVSCYAGIPLTHRSMSRGVRMVTGHFRDGEVLDLDWEKLADASATLVVYMGLSNLEIIARQLMQAGRAADTPAAVIQEGTTPRQRMVQATLSTLSREVERAGLSSPVMIIIGETVTLADQLAWYQPREMSNETPCLDRR